MPRHIRRPFARLAAMFAALCLISCEQAPPEQGGNDINVDHARAAADALDKVTADSRKARISNLEYDAFVDIAASEEELVGEVSIQFDLSDASASLTLDFTGGTVNAVQVNGETSAADYNGFYITLPAEQLQLGANTIDVAYRHPFGHDGNGLHRFVDPQDGLTYMHSYLWPYYANRLLPSFDQPSLKANFSLRVIAPESWNVFSMQPGEATAASDGTRLWTFGKTPKIPTYIFSLHAGPYKIWSDDSGDVPLRLMARQSLAEYVAVDEWFETTQKGMTFYNDYFDIPYPFEKYDQLIVPEFNIGGMENAAAVSFTEGYVQRQTSNREQRESRTSTILHELAHMWFGNLVTHDWWNGMWLNESFATQMATLALVETTEFTDQWHGYFTNSKKRAYGRDSQVTTHPIEMPLDSTDQFTTLFDAITYQKGGSVLKQLQHRVGKENYRRGVAAYLKENSYSTTELADFIGHQGKSAGVDLGDWSDEWLMTSGFNTLSVASECDGERLSSLGIVQSSAADQALFRTHKVDVALYNLDADGSLTITTSIPVLVEGERTSVPVPDEQPCPAIVNPNHNDWAFARFALSASDETLLSEHLGDVEDPLSRSMFLAGLSDKAMAGNTSIAAFIRQAVRLAETESNFRVLEQISASLLDAVNIMHRLRPETDAALPRALRDVEELSLRLAHFAATQDVKQLWLNTFLNVVASESGLATARAILDGEAEIDGIELSPEDRWQLLIILSRHNADGVADLMAAEIERDSSDFSQRNLLSARAAAPNLANKEYWIAELQAPQELNSLAKQRAVMVELFPATQTDLQLQVLEKILSSLPQMSREADPYFLSSYTSTLLTPMCRPDSSALMQSTLDEFGAQLNPTALRFVREAHQLDVECHALRVANK
jgi:aminopeptidase N